MNTTLPTESKRCILATGGDCWCRECWRDFERACTEEQLRRWLAMWAGSDPPKGEPS